LHTIHAAAEQPAVKLIKLIWTTRNESGLQPCSSALAGRSSVKHVLETTAQLWSYGKF
jgi:hypothetical protein